MVSLGVVAVLAYLSERANPDDRLDYSPSEKEWGFLPLSSMPLGEADRYEEDPEGPSGLTVRGLLDAVGQYSEP
ncbi:hypothetical protein OP10G_2743 [Fimbriimonas ginsengisoli Gsoil 348]|uniref:Uncharacterized protein n=1 Tax=Fimbriimonas ginsengisoli Gsoil 348 TaxID=661478 RepID=A0A068NRR6_FIMGI|nr:hypothetical protein OP10G_2743 [Fimbriimonas ginsengisoli Gsoil 348]